MSSTDASSSEGGFAIVNFTYCHSNPHDVRCEQVEGFMQYDLSVAANATFLAIFSLSLLLYLVTYALTRRGLGFTVALSLGLICEILGYAGRLILADNRWDENGFLIQICCLTIAPAFMAGGIYLCLRRIVYVFGKEASRIKPEMYTRIFIPCDVVSLVLQAVGGALASTGSHNSDRTQVDTGDNIMIAGLAFQVLTLLIFMLFALDFAWRTHRRQAVLGAAALEQDPIMSKIRGSWQFKGFLAALATATIAIFIRSVFRVAELSEGWTGSIMGNQGMFIGFEGVCIVVAVLVLNAFHPAICFRDMLEGEGGFGGIFRRNKKDIEASGKSESASVEGVVE